MVAAPEPLAGLQQEPTQPSDLAAITQFADLPPEGLAWLAGRMVTVHIPAGETVVREGDPALYMVVILEGEMRGSSESAGDSRSFVARAGQVTGQLPFSRLTTFPLTSRAVVPSKVALLHKDHFPEMLERLPVLGQRLVSIMADRIREITKMDVQREKMMALGKLSAGLAHELNNPASAARRAAASLREAAKSVRMARIRIDGRGLTREQLSLLSRVEREVLDGPAPLVMDPLERSDREEEVVEWIEKRGIGRSWELAPGLVESGFDISCLEEVAAGLPCDVVGDALTLLTALVTVGHLIDEIENSTARIADLVKSIKEYSYMDQAAEQEVDVHQGIESTLVMLRHQLKHGIVIRRDYAPDLPRVCARGGELNQVWTNLIDNAVAAMKGQGELRIRTARELQRVLVEIGDNGPGIPPEIQNRIFEPFFTTKAVGEGTGLGLDMVYRIVQSHHGEIRVESKPGDTRFQVRLPAA